MIWEKIFHEQSYCVNPPTKLNHYTNMVKSAIQIIYNSLKRKSSKMRGPPLCTILEYLYANSKVGKSKSSKMKVYSALKKMVALKELIETSINGNLYYKPSDN